MTNRAHQTKETATILTIRLPDGTILSEDDAADTLVAFINMVGVERVIPLKIVVNRQPFVARSPMPKYGKSASSWKPVGDYYIETLSNTDRKRRIVIEIASALGISISAEISKV